MSALHITILCDKTTLSYNHVNLILHFLAILYFKNPQFLFVASKLIKRLDSYS